MRKDVFLVALAAALLAASSVQPRQTPESQRIDSTVVQRIRAEALEHSRIPETAEILTDEFGARLSGSPGLKRAEEWIVHTLSGEGIEAHLEPWGPFGRGWELSELRASMTAPQYSPLIAYAKAWSGGTNGAIAGDAIYLGAATTEGDLAKFRGKLRGKIVLFAPPRALQPNFDPPPERTSNEELRKMEQESAGDQKPFEPSPQQRAAAEFNQKKWELIYAEQPAVVIEPGSKDAGTVYVTAAMIPESVHGADGKQMQPWNVSKPKVVPQLVISAEQYNRMARLAARGEKVSMEVSIAVRYFDDDPMSANVIAEIPGSDLKQEFVMLGGCMDSWHAGTGATDNAAGIAVAMEVMRIFKELNLHPRRTIRMGLWSAEEEGRLGSPQYVAKHLGRVVNGKVEKGPEYENFDAYFNLDYGTGRIRGIYLQGNEAARPIFHAWLAPFADLGASTTTIRSIGADHSSFDAIGLPGFQFLRDYMEFGTRTAHTNMDVYDHMLLDDLKQSAAVAAAIVYDAAMNDAKIPRKPPSSSQ